MRLYMGTSEAPLATLYSSPSSVWLHVEVKLCGSDLYANITANMYVSCRTHKRAHETAGTASREALLLNRVLYTVWPLA